MQWSAKMWFHQVKQSPLSQCVFLLGGNTTCHPQSSLEDCEGNPVKGIHQKSCGWLSVSLSFSTLTITQSTSQPHTQINMFAPEAVFSSYAWYIPTSLDFYRKKKSHRLQWSCWMKNTHPFKSFGKTKISGSFLPSELDPSDSCGISPNTIILNCDIWFPDLPGWDFFFFFFLNPAWELGFQNLWIGVFHQFWEILIISSNMASAHAFPFLLLGLWLNIHLTSSLCFTCFFNNPSLPFK